MSTLPPSYLGKKVYLDGANKRYYVIRYEERIGKKKANVLLFDQEAPVIFAVIDNDGSFLDSFYLTNKTTEASAKALERFKKMTDRKKHSKLTQDDLRDALKPESEAKMKNTNILKHLTDEFLDDIKQQWPSRLVTLQNADGKSEDSLIMVGLKEAIDRANPAKSFQFLTRHRYDQFVPMLGKHINSQPQLLDEITRYYLTHNQVEIVENFLYEAVRNVEIDNQGLIEQLLNTAKRLDHIYYSNVMRHVLSRLFKRVKAETGEAPKDWLNETINDRSLRQSIIHSIKKKTG